jgi:hypothetical protein
MAGGLAAIHVAIYQLSWKTLPGLRGLSCSDFRATPTESPDTERGVAITCASEAKCDALLCELESHFASQRFSNNAAAFETVKEFVLSRSGEILTGDLNGG